MPRPRWALQMEAVMWRNLMDIGMKIHTTAKPSAPAPTKTVSIPTSISAQKGSIDLHFYYPLSHPHYLHDNSSSTSFTFSHLPRPSRKYPVVVNFHGGGFTIGRATDDARWARAVVEYADAVVVAVDYRLAPEYPFPTAIEDGVDAALWLIEHSEELHLDPDRMAFSGFSAGGNMAFSVPIRLAEEYRIHREAKNGTVREGSVVAIASWYPSLDYTKTREERRNTNVKPSANLPNFFTDLFDASYLHSVPGKQLDLNTPWLSPGIAPDSMIKNLPRNIIFYTCEYDELQAEGQRFYERLIDENHGFGKNVVYKMITGVPHAFDRSPKPFVWDPKFERMYKDACRELRTVFYGHPGDDEMEREELLSAEEDEVGKQGEVETRIERVDFPKAKED